MAFASFPLDELGLSPHQLAICTRANLTTSSQILNPSLADLSRRLRTLKNEVVQEIVWNVSKAIIPEVMTVESLLDWGDEQDGEGGEGRARGVVKVGVGDDGRGMWVGTGDMGIDHALGGGIRIGSLTEITGESASGKSHITLTLSLSCQIPRLTPNPGGVIFLTSERELPTDRLIQLAKPLLETHHYPYYPRHPTLPLPGQLNVKILLDNIHTSLISDIDKLDHALGFGIPALLKTRNGVIGSSPLLGRQNDLQGNGQPIRLLIIDSITALLRGTDTSLSSTAGGLSQRSRYLCSISDKLKALALEYNLAIVVINQVSDVFLNPIPRVLIPPPPQTQQPSSSFGPSSSFAFGCDGPQPPMLYATQSRWFSGQSDGLLKEASLGIVWANAVNTRIMLSRTGRRRLLREGDLSVVKRRKKEDVEENGDMGVVVDDATPTLVRRMHVIFSGSGPAGTLDYAITGSGVHSLAESWRLVDVVKDGEKRKRRKMGRDRQKEEDGVGRGGDEEVERGVGVQSGGGGEGGGNGGAGETDGDELDEFDDEYAGEVFDDLGDLPAEFWEGKVPVQGDMLAQGVGIDY